MTKLTGSIIGICAILGLFWSSYQYLNTNFAKAAEVQQLEQRLDAKIIEDRLKAVQERLWRIEDRYEKAVMPKSVKEEKQILIDEKRTLEIKLTIIQGGK